LSLTVERVFGLVNPVRQSGASMRRFGVPPRGPFDRESFLLAGALVGESGEVLEVLAGSVSLRASAACLVACVGAVGGVSLDGVTKPPLSSFLVPAGASLSVSVGASGNAVYIASGSGRFEGRLSDPPLSLSAGALRYLAAEGFEGLKIPSLSVNPSGNRMGVRLDGLSPSGLEERPSEPCCVGAIQWTPSGQAIAVGPDGPTIGGYPKIGYVIEADLDRLAHLRPGQQISLVAVTFEEALSLAKVRGEAIERRIRQLKAAKFLIEG